MNSDTAKKPLNIERTEQLSWELLDDRLSESGLKELEKLMLEDAECVKCYVSCLQLEQDLKQLFRADMAEQQAAPEGKIPEFPTTGFATDGNLPITS